MTLESFEITRTLLLSAGSFLVAWALLPGLWSILKRLNIGKTIRSASSAPVFAKLHAKKVGTPTMGGVLVWGTVLLLALTLSQVAVFFPQTFLAKLSFLTRSQTLLPLGALIASAFVGLFDDYFNARGIGAHGGGLTMKHRLLIYTGIALVGAAWFQFKLDWDLLHIPFVGDFNIGLWYLPFFLLVIVATAFSVNETDGLDGLAGGGLFAAFSAYAVIAFSQGKYDLAAFCGAIIGALLAFLWFNIYPAKFFMGDTGAMSLGVTLGIVAMLTNSAFLLPIIGLIFVIESGSVLLQWASKAIRHKKLFLSAPLHHHLEAKGYPEPHIVMRFWVLALVSGALGTALFLLDALSYGYR